MPETAGPLVHQVLASASPGDAVTQSALALAAELQRLGPSRVFALHRHPDLHRQVDDLTAFAQLTRGSPPDLIIYHLSIGDPSVVRILLGLDVPISIVYHNMTPADCVREFDPGLAHLLDVGRQELMLLADRVERAVGVSTFNSDELRQAGYRNVATVPLWLDWGRHVRAGSPVDRRLSERLTGEDSPLVLFVGQMVPHKAIDWLIQAHCILSTFLVPRARLALVGPTPNSTYRSRLVRYIDELGISGWVTIAGRVSDAALATWYRHADVLVTASEHEGFCAPLVEAMATGVPVVARDFGAISETIGRAGVVLAKDDSPAVGAEVLAEILSCPALRADLVERGQARVTELYPPRLRGQALGFLLEPYLDLTGAGQ